MPPPKKAVKKAAPKKAATKEAGGHNQDLRRCYEHFGRTIALQPLLLEGKSLNQVAAMAQELLRRNDFRSAADILRAGEHLCFGTLALEAAHESISEALTRTMQSEIVALLERAEHHASEGNLSPAVKKVYTAMRKGATKAFKSEQYRAASEMARGAEALSHVTADFTGRLRAANLSQLELA